MAVVSVVGTNTKMAMSTARSKYTNVSVIRGLMKPVMNPAPIDPIIEPAPRIDMVQAMYQVQ